MQDHQIDVGIGSALPTAVTSQCDNGHVGAERIGRFRGAELFHREFEQPKYDRVDQRSQPCRNLGTGKTPVVQAAHLLPLLAKIVA